MNPEKDSPSIPPHSETPRSRRRSGPSPWIFVAIAALAVAGWQWFDTRQKLAEMRSEVAQSITEGNEERGAQKRLREQVEAIQGKLGALDDKLGEFRSQGEALQGLYQEMARSREEATLIEVEQAITLAGQQLQLAGNVPVAVLALQTADARLARLDRPQHLPLRKALAKDLQRLNAIPFVDFPGLSLRLEQLLLGVDKLPLASDGRPSAKVEKLAIADDKADWWQRTGQAVWQELKGLVRIQRFDREAPALLAPGQDFFLRENLKLRLLNARLALFARDQATFRNELKVAQEWVGRYFDQGDKSVLSNQTMLRQIASSDINVELPTLSDSQAALRSLRPGKDKK